MTRYRLVKEIRYFCGRVVETEPGTSYHSQARNCLRARIRQLIALELYGAVARWKDIYLPPGAEDMVCRDGLSRSCSCIEAGDQ